ncbi:MAG: LacI family DNA-binding transcriptional regulator [Actinomyces sp.]|uniref:LacI family DNA-binding transcriptional regulator n=1 Tax=Actinomyces sp. TaxID=29317 RepID=UPI0026DB6408|nr:LacI family DNA-binding transcriptional regulator [Actinomyces sp.]MDO4242352.1 LacI family DNA-binding transcriptional regulator [Actinomyces sp.]
MTTLRDVAALARVSAMTVSNVVNGREEKVSAATAERVRAAIDELGYVPNAQARALAGASSRIIALVYSVPGTGPALAGGHSSVFVGACEQACQEADHTLMLCSTRGAAGPVRPEELRDRLRAWNVAGVIVLGGVPVSLRSPLGELDVPVVLIDDYGGDGSPDGADGEVDGGLRVNIDDLGGGRQAGERIAGLGHRAVAVVGPLSVGSPVVEARLRGLRQGLADPTPPGGGDPARIELVDVPEGFEAGVRAGQSLGDRMREARDAASGTGHDEPVTAVFATSDVLALGVVAGLRRAGLEVPRDVSVVGFDGFEVSTYCDPPLTTVCQPIGDKAARAVELLTDRPAPPGTCVVLPVSWREGGTLAPAPDPGAPPSS